MEALKDIPLCKTTFSVATKRVTKLLRSKTQSAIYWKHVREGGEGGEDGGEEGGGIRGRKGVGGSEG